MYKLVVSELAHRDLDNIVSYIAVQLANPIAATHFLDEVEKCYGYLKSNPLSLFLWCTGLCETDIKKFSVFASICGHRIFIVSLYSITIICACHILGD